MKAKPRKAQRITTTRRSNGVVMFIKLSVHPSGPSRQRRDLYVVTGSFENSRCMYCAVLIKKNLSRIRED